MDARILGLSERQHGVVTRQQLLAEGICANTIRSTVRSGRLLRVSYGVYVLPGTVDSHAREVMVAALRCGPGARIAGERMLAFLNVHEASRSGPFVVLTRPGRRVTGVPWLVRPNLLGPDDDVAVIDRIPSFRPARHLLEAAVHRSDGDVERLVDGLRWSRHGVSDLQALVAHTPMHPGSRRLAASGLIDVGVGESPPERTIDTLLAHLHPSRQVLLLDRYRVDLYFAVARLVIEYDGPLHRAPARRAKDQRRDDDLRQAGIEVIRLTKEDLADEDALVRRIEAVIARRAAMLAAEVAG